ncbi:MAG: glycerol-3-phosphate dehydrogenase/oxidase [Archangiaceae bacterium]|nr:glycerol-3-phosphate dehydrogenase/oxidase [Archangiaceae bacterium]
MSGERSRTFELAAAGGWDLVVVGGGITGAGILDEAARRGLKALLVDQGDFASGTSSRSSKLVHGGLRYLAEGDLRLTWQAVGERERLLAELPGLVEPIGFLLASYEGDRLGRRLVRLGLQLYDLLGSGVKHRALSAEDLAMLAPRLSLDGSTGGFWYRDAQTDDARLVLRVLFDAVALGASALNYARVEGLVMRGGAAGGVVLRDGESGRAARVEARAVVNATGAWADCLRAEVSGKPAIRPLRGSHLLFPAWRFPVAQAVTFRHLETRRPLFACPWEGLTLLGTTDLDHDRPLDDVPYLAPGEATSMVEAARAAFPQLTLHASDAVSSFSGVRPVIGTGQKDPSKESRDHAIWSERGLWTVTGGKLTTFRAIAREAVDALGLATPAPDPPARRRDGAPSGIEDAQQRRLEGRYGAAAPALVAAAREGELERIPETATLWAELRHGARAEAVVHLDDLLLRRVRLGLLLPEGAREHLPRIRRICQGELGWADERWHDEERRYLAAWAAQHRPPAQGSSTRAQPLCPGSPTVRSCERRVDS